jgi:hypothetical protein
VPRVAGGSRVAGEVAGYQGLQEASRWLERKLVARVAGGSRVAGEVAGCQGLQGAAGWLER